MKLTVQHLGLAPAATPDTWIARQLERLRERLRIDEARVRLAHEREASPPYRVRVHLVTPGPDVVAEACDHTLGAAFRKVMAQLGGKLAGRTMRRLRRLKGRVSGRTHGWSGHGNAGTAH